MIRIDWRELKYRVADALFNYELDDAFRMGVESGSEFAIRKLSFAMNLKDGKLNMTKTEQKGYEKALAVFAEERELVEKQTGLR